jgi:hypothetical protein
LEDGGFVSKGLVKLILLEANSCKIRKVEVGAFNGLTNLMLLSLNRNEISEIIPGTFDMKSFPWILTELRTFVFKHFASYQGYPNYRWDLIRYARC